MPIIGKIIIGIAISTFVVPIGIIILISNYEKGQEAEITELVKALKLELKDDYFCYEAKCFGVFSLPNNRNIDFFITRHIAERTIEDIKLLETNWGLAQSLCNKVEFTDGIDVCKIGGEILTYKEWYEQKAELKE